MDAVFPDSEAMAGAVGKRVWLRGEVAKFGKRRSNGCWTVLLDWLTDVQGNWLRDHQWVDYAAFEDAQVRVGDLVVFEARVEEYYRPHLRGHRGEPVGVGYRLVNVQGVRVV